MAETEIKHPRSEEGVAAMTILARSVAGSAALGMLAAVLTSAAPVIASAGVVGLLGGYFAGKLDKPKAPPAELR